MYNGALNDLVQEAQHGIGRVRANAKFRLTQWFISKTDDMCQIQTSTDHLPHRFAVNLRGLRVILRAIRA